MIQLLRPKIIVFQHTTNGNLLNYLRLNGFDAINSNLENIADTYANNVCDLAILDYSDGKDTNTMLSILAEIKKNCGKSLVIILSGVADPDAVVRAFTHGTDDYVAMPYSAAEMICRIKNQLNKRRLSIRPLKNAYKIKDLYVQTFKGIITIRGAKFAVGERNSFIMGMLCEYYDETLPYKNMLTALGYYENIQKTHIALSLVKLVNVIELSEHLQILRFRSFGCILTDKE